MIVSDALLCMVERIELYSGAMECRELESLNSDIHDFAPSPKVIQPLDYMRSIDAALKLLPEKADWRRLTPTTMSVYAASPYNAQAQTRYDGSGPWVAAQMCAAIFRMAYAQEQKRAVAEARRKSA